MDNGRDAKTFATWESLHAIAAKLEPASKLELTSDVVIYEPGVEGGRYYKPVSTGELGPISPFTNIIPPMVITWLDSGTTPPASISSGQPADQTVSLINLTLPQTHTLARFNISAGAGFVLHDRAANLRMGISVLCGREPAYTLSRSIHELGPGHCLFRTRAGNHHRIEPSSDCNHRTHHGFECINRFCRATVPMHL
jgi:hypothetical protein